MTPAVVTASITPAPAGAGRTRLLVALVLLLLVAAPLIALGALVLDQRPTAANALAASTTMDAANALFASGQADLAAQAYAQLIAQGHGGKALRYNLGIAHLEAGNAEQAVDALRTAQRIFPRDGAIRSALADAQALQRSSAALDGAALDGAALDGAALDGAAAETAAAIAQPASGILAQLRLEWISATEAAFAALLFWTLLAALLLVAITAPARSGRRTGALLAALLPGAGLAFALLLLTV